MFSRSVTAANLSKAFDFIEFSICILMAVISFSFGKARAFKIEPSCTFSSLITVYEAIFTLGFESSHFYKKNEITLRVLYNKEERRYEIS